MLRRLESFTSDPTAQGRAHFIRARTHRILAALAGARRAKLAVGATDGPGHAAYVAEYQPTIGHGDLVSRSWAEPPARIADHVYVMGEAIEGLGLGLTWFRQTSVDEVWSAIWLKHRTEFRTLNH